ncbi:prolyl 4-hydroxylase subunit alpha-1-like [Silurus meridionalis]|uniref:prolyl 4-hydroxylase subunit alpha-1-like n=1 Tax=Silurus meridionalis TaxID=175797 RepID=UPI001EEB1B15|nr:prolyl 4-hydroxylase subunit alpha-1-like [Silurus meridionalis]
MLSGLKNHMTHLIGIKNDLSQCLRFYISSLENQMDLLKRALQGLECISDDNSKDPEKLISNPLIAYKFVKQLINVGTAIKEITKTNISKDIDMLMSKSQLIPSENNLDGIAGGIVRLQELYRLNPEDMIKLETQSALSPDECFHIAVIAQQNQKFQCAIQWLGETMKKLHDGAKAMVTKQRVQTLLTSIQSQVVNSPFPPEATQILQHYDDLDLKTILQSAYTYNLSENIKYWDGMQHFITSLDMSGFYNPWKNGYEALCRGEGIKMNPKRQRKLVCRYTNGKGSPRLIYGPAKEEEEWDEPLILRYHDFISLNEIEVIKTLSRSKLARAKVSDPVTGKLISTKARVSKSAWLSIDESPVVASINQRIADVTGLDMDTAEELQVANYGIGGQYEPHYDLVDGVPFTERRIATLLVYMSDVDVGGATVFPNTGAALTPKIGSAVIWFNLLKSGEEDTRTLHAACPVFIGSKWVANKWICCGGQEFRRRCALSKAG